MPKPLLRYRALMILALSLVVTGCAGAPRRFSLGHDAAIQPTLITFRQRLAVAHAQIPTIAASADAAAQRTVEFPAALISTPSAIQVGFSEELGNRAGGLGNVLDPDGRRGEITPHDVVLFAVRSWEKDGAEVAPLLAGYRAKGWLVIVIGSAKGKPANLAADYFIDNGAPGPEAGDGRVNAIANMLDGWMWCCEYVAAMTRRGKCPGVLMSVSYSKADIYDAPLQKMPGGRQWQGECRHSVPAGELARAYLERVERLSRELASTRTQAQLSDAADLIASRLAARRKVMISGIGHGVMYEMLEDHRAGWKGFSPGDPKTTFAERLTRGDLLLWIGYVGMNSAYADYGKGIHDTDCDLIACETPDPDPSRDGPWAMVHLDQSWALGDAEVTIPCPPGRMAPISGINGTLLLRMLDDEVVRRLSVMATTAPAAR